MTYRIQFIADYENIARGSIVRVSEEFAVRMVESGYAVYYVI